MIGVSGACSWLAGKHVYQRTCVSHMCIGSILAGILGKPGMSGGPCPCLVCTTLRAVPDFKFLVMGRTVSEF